MRRELRAGRFDVVHVHEPPAPDPRLGRMLASAARPWSAPSTPTRPSGCRTRSRTCSARGGSSTSCTRGSPSREAAAWTGRRWFGGNYHVIPNGVDVDAPPPGPKPASDELRVLFVGRPEERKGLPVLLQAFEGLVEHVPARLTVIGAARRRRRALRRRSRGRGAHRRARARSGSELWRQLHEADVLCAPSLAGESFGMVLTEAFAAGTPVIASEIAGYADVVTRRRRRRARAAGRPAAPRRGAPAAVPRARAPPGDGPGGPRERPALRVAARRRAGRGASTSRRCDAPEPGDRAERSPGRAAWRRSTAPAARPPQRLPSLDPRRPGRLAAPPASPAGSASAWPASLGVGLTALAAHKIGLQNVVASIVRSDLGWVLIATGLMMSSMFMRAVSWLAIARAALPRRPLRRRDVTSATMIGVLMSATLPARLGEPARAMVLARRTGRMRETFPVLLGTLVSQTVLNIARAGAAGRDHRRLDRPVPLELDQALRCSASRRCSLVAVLAGAGGRPAADRVRARGAVARRSARRCCGSAPASSSSATRAAGRSPPARSSRPGASSSWPAPRCSRRSG